MNTLKLIYEAARTAELAYDKALRGLPENSIFSEFLARQVDINRKFALELLNSAPGEVEPQPVAGPDNPPPIPPLYVDKIGSEVGLLVPRNGETLFTLTAATHQAHPNYLHVGFHCITYNGIAAHINGKYGFGGAAVYSAIVHQPASAQDFEEALKYHVVNHIQLAASPHELFMAKASDQVAEDDKTRIG